MENGRGALLPRPSGAKWGRQPGVEAPRLHPHSSRLPAPYYWPHLLPHRWNNEEPRCHQWIRKLFVVIPFPSGGAITEDLSLAFY